MAKHKKSYGEEGYEESSGEEAKEQPEAPEEPKRTKDRNGTELKIGDTVGIRFTVREISEDGTEVELECIQSTVDPDAKGPKAETVSTTLIEKII